MNTHRNIIAKQLARLWRYIFETNDSRRLRRQRHDTSDLSVLADIAYIADGTQEHLLDIYRPANGSDRLPVIVNIHGGGLFASYKTVNTWFNHECARMGYTVVSISYRRLPDTTLVHQIEDVIAALRFISDQRECYHLDLDRCYLTGDSAGALLGLFALAIEHNEALQHAFRITPAGITFRAAAFISIMLDTQRTAPMAFLGKLVADAEDAGKPYLPYILHPDTLVGQAQLPPVYLVTSAQDLIREDTLRLARLFTSAGVEHRLRDLPKGKRHALVHVFCVQYPTWDESRQILQEIDAFFRDNASAAIR